MAISTALPHGLDATCTSPSKPSTTFPSAIPRSKDTTVFDPALHFAYRPPKGRYTLADLGLGDVGLSPLAVTEPFPLLTRAGVCQMRRDVLSPESFERHGFTSYKAAFQAREHSESVAPFMHQFWKHPRVVAAVSEAAGIDLVPIMDIELGHTNFQVGAEGIEGLKKLPIDPVPAPELSPEEKARLEAIADRDFGEKNPVFIEHVDNYPFVCVLMLSDVKNMIGGQTGLRCGDGSMIKARGPEVGSAVVMQGRHVRHCGLHAFNTNERITMVCSFRAKDVMVKDSSILAPIKIISRANRINFYWTNYRFKLLSERFAIMAERLEQRKAALGPDNDNDGQGGGEVVNKKEMEAWIHDQIEYLQTTLAQLM